MATPPVNHSIPGPERLSLEGNVDRNFKQFKRAWSTYEIASRIKEQPAVIRAATLVAFLKPEVQEVLEGLPFPSEIDRQDAVKIIEVLENFCVGTCNETYERYKFGSRNQKLEEHFDAYVGSLRVLAKSCNFGELHDSLIRDRIVLGIRSENTRRKLLCATELTLQRCINICRAEESTDVRAKEIKGSEAEEALVHAFRNSKYPRDGSRLHRHENRSPVQSESSKWTNKRDVVNCKFCGKNHVWNKLKCPAWGKTCLSCKEKNHFKNFCPKGRNVHAIDDDVCDDELCCELDESKIAQVSITNAVDAKSLCATLVVNNNSCTVQVDTGCQSNIIGRKYVPNVKLVPSTKTLIMWNKTRKAPLGECEVLVENPANRKKYMVKFIVVDTDWTPLLCYKTSVLMKLLTINEHNMERVYNIDTDNCAKTISEYGEVFHDTLGQLPGVAHFEVDESVSPVVSPCRKVPLALRPVLKSKLRDLTEKGVIAPVNQPTDWLSNLVHTPKKNGDIRICLDPRPLNVALKRERFPMPLLKDLLPELSQAKVFSTFDLRNGYWHVVLDQESSLLTTFETPFGRYRWCRLPFGTKVSSELFQKRLYQVLGDLNGICNVADDILVYGTGETVEDAVVNHDFNLTAFLQRCREVGIRLNKEKMWLKQSQVSFLGHLLTDHGIKADPEKVEAIGKMPPPEDLEGVRRLAGTINYLSEFLPKLATVMEPINMLMRKDVPFQWAKAQQKAFAQVKELVCGDQVLQYYNPNKELTVQCDASQYGLGAALLQEHKPVAFASRALTETETRYAQIEKELLAIVFALEKFHQYAYGRPVIVRSDHKPLEAILTKPLFKAPKRLQGMMLRLQKYDFEVKYLKGKDMLIADTLSRAFLPTSTLAGPQDNIECVHMSQYLSITNERLKAIKRDTSTDPILQELKGVIMEGWPEKRDKLSAAVGLYHHFRDELTVTDGLIFRGERVVIPTASRKTLLNKIHSSHLGMDGCLRRARESLYWPNYSNDIKEFISLCSVCRDYERANQRETLMSHDIPDRPWATVGADMFSLDSKDFLVLVDYFSGFFEIDRLKDTTALSIIVKMKNHFARYGAPEKVVSDNGPQFSCTEFVNFANTWDFDHCPSSPGNSRANGKAEAAVKVAKSLIKKACASQQDIYLALLDHRNTPSAGQETSPVQRSLGRRTRTMLPTAQSLLKPTAPIDIRRQLKIQQSKQAHYYDKHARDLEALEEGDTVRLQPFVNRRSVWKKGQVIRRLDERSYDVECGSKVLRRNRVHLKKTGEMGSIEQTQVENLDKCVTPCPTQPVPISDTTSSRPEVTTPNEVEAATNTKTTRSGRTVKPPVKLSDYEVYK